MTVHLPKLQSGEHFDNLGMLTTLLSKKPAKATQSQKPLIEVIGANGLYYMAPYSLIFLGILVCLCVCVCVCICFYHTSSCTLFRSVRDSCSSESEDDIDWQAEQILSEDHPLNHTPSLMPNAIAYGFANQHSGVFLKLQVRILDLASYLISWINDIPSQK